MGFAFLGEFMDQGLKFGLLAWIAAAAIVYIFNEQEYRHNRKVSSS
jgi:hypothetical protein